MAATIYTPDPSITERYARLLLHYCLEAKEGQKLFVSSSTLAEPLLQALHREAVKTGVAVEYDLAFANKSRILWEAAGEAALRQEPVFHTYAMEHFDLFLTVRAPHDLYEDMAATGEQKKIRATATKRASDLYFQRTADKSLVRSLCQWPTQAAADAAGMTLDAYAQFVFNACRLDEPDPVAAWLDVRKNQQVVVDRLNRADRITYRNAKTDISFRVKDRIWINSDGRANMPSGEVFTGPIEDTVNGVVHFDYPSVYGGHDVKGITLTVRDGEVVKWEAEEGQAVLDQIFAIEGSRYFGEVAVGTNYRIQRTTRNILFDEKIGGSIHMAVGQSYLQTGGKNKSAVHWDMIANMKDGGEIIADGEVIYRDGHFLFADR